MMKRLDQKSQIASWKSSGFTLVELLVVVTIIGILIALLLPAVQAAREAARKLQCSNHLKQLALGCLGHEQAQGFLPTAGWAWWWTGDPDRGFDRRQSGGWCYNLLPFIEQQPLHEIGAGMTLTNKKAALVAVAQTPMAVLYCPTRREPTLYPNTYTMCNVNLASLTARTDYAANGGTVGPTWWSPPNPSDGNPSFSDVAGFAWPSFSASTGLFFPTSTVRMCDITDGASNTYLLGEKYLCADHYLDGQEGTDNNVVYEGYDWDDVRWSIWDGATKTYRPPLQDTPGYSDYLDFGSAHAGSLNMSLCDGSVRSVNYSIDMTVHGHLCDRKDEAPLDAGKL
jgi:prepilin-type N-terminal cleavage/methylation domain-containing protein/prepilin-type processing-associated H-X9-DG protein